MYKLYNNDCFDILPTLEENSIDMVCCDPPYGTTAIEWDTVLDFTRMWSELKRVCTPKCNILIFGSQPFSSQVIVSNLEHFRYELIWNKNKCGSPGLSKYRPQKVHENIMLFNANSPGTYNPIMEKGKPYVRDNPGPNGYGSGINTHKYGFKQNKGGSNTGTRYPKSILHASRNFSAQQTVHPTQKPTNLLNWLIMTYSNENDTVLDFTMGSGGCGVSALLTNRNFIGIEQDKHYYDIANARIQATHCNTVTPDQQQLTTQIHPDMVTKPEHKPEGEILTNIRNDEVSNNLGAYFNE